nr:MAG TPA: hypothetical protein [Caudoviricetes sp.]
MKKLNRDIYYKNIIIYYIKHYTKEIEIMER